MAFTIDALGSTLATLGVSQDDIDEITGILKAQRQQVGEGSPEPIADTSFGGFGSGLLLGHHTSTAHRHVAEAMDAMAQGLLGYLEAVTRAGEDFFDTDAEVQDRIRRITEAADQVGGTDFHGDGDGR